MAACGGDASAGANGGFCRGREPSAMLGLTSPTPHAWEPPAAGAAAAFAGSTAVYTDEAADPAG